MTANIYLGLACLIFLLFLGALFMVMGTSRSDMSGFVIFPILSVPLFGLLSAAYWGIASRGELDWIGAPRGLQYLCIIVVCLTSTVIIGFSAILLKEPASDMPWSMRPFVPWAPFVLPPVLIAVAFLWLNKDVGFSVAWLRGAYVCLGAMGLLTGMGLLGELLYSSQQRAVQGVDAIQEEESERDRTIMDKVKAADPEKDLGSLLPQTSRFEKPAIRELALRKVLSNSNFNAAMAAQLRGPAYFGSALTFLRDNDIPDKALLAEPVRDALRLVAQQVRDTMRTAYNPRGAEFIADADTVLCVADKFSNSGVDYVPAIREYRAALDEPGKSERYKEAALKSDIAARAQIDRWLARRGK